MAGTAPTAERDGHRACSWKDSPLEYNGDSVGDPSVATLRATQALWSSTHPEMVLPYKFPTSRRDCVKITYRALKRMEALAPTEYNAAMNEVLHGFPQSVVRVVSALGLNYLHPHHKAIAAQGRHLLMVKVYETRAEAHCWFIPLKEVLVAHAQTSEVLKSGISLNDVQLVETYDVGTVLALHAETFVCKQQAGGRGNTYGECTWIGGMAFHAAAHSDEAFEKSQEFAMVPDEDMEGLAAKHAANREKRARKKASQKQRKQEEKAAAEAVAAEAAAAEEEAAAAEAAARRASKLQVHGSLAEALAKGRL